MVSASEHPAVYNAAHRLEKKGIIVKDIPLQSNGKVDFEEFKNFSKRCLIDGNVEDMDELFNAVLGNNKYDELLDKLDSYYKDYLLAYRSKKQCTLFNISTQYIDIKDNYVGLFLEKKYQRKLAFK